MSAVFDLLVQVFLWAYKIVAFCILAGLPIRILIKAFSGQRGSFL